MNSHLTTRDLRDLKKFLMDLRFIQAGTLVAAGVNDDKKAIDYMKSLSRMEKLIDFELRDKLS